MGLEMLALRDSQGEHKNGRKRVELLTTGLVNCQQSTASGCTTQVSRCILLPRDMASVLLVVVSSQYPELATHGQNPWQWLDYQAMHTRTGAIPELYYGVLDIDKAANVTGRLSWEEQCGSVVEVRAV